MRTTRVIVVAFSITGCASNAEVAQLRQQLTESKTQAESLKAAVDKLNTTLDELKNSIELDKIFRDADSEAYLTPGSEGYTLVKTDLGTMSVKLDNIVPYANGSRITLQFGNLTSATVTGAKTTLEWGSVTAKGHPDYASMKTREVTFNESLRAGAWTNVSVVLEGVPPTSLGFVRVKGVGHRGIRLLR